MTAEEKVNDALEMFDIQEAHEFGAEKASAVPVPHAIYSARSARGNNLELPQNTGPLASNR